MSGPLLETKLYVPRLRRQLVSRPRLTASLARATEARLTLISAPAGFGKSTLLTEWIAAVSSEQVSISWLSLDEQDNDVTRFWTYVVAAIHRAVPGVGADLEDYLWSAHPQAVQEALALLINQLSSISRDLVLVLDDYHLITLPAIHEGLTFLLEHLPPAVHLIIASRADPPVPLASLRARGDLVELRAADLRFKADEAASYLNGVMELGLTTRNVDALEGQTEGWIAALQLVALSMQGREDVAGFIDAFTGDNRYVVDYLVQEVLQRQPEEMRSFLLDTSILERLNGSLCDVVTGRADSQARLRSLEDGNVFIVPLDDRRDWYRYHHLFADVLRAHLLAEGPDRVHDLHLRASSWFEQTGSLPDAIRHALAASAFEQAADLIERAMPDMLRAREEGTLRALVDALPDELVSRRPVLNIGYIGVLMHGGEMASIQSRLDDVERVLESGSETPWSLDGPREPRDLVYQEQLRELPGMVALYRAGYAQVTGDLPGTVTHARLAIERLPPEHPLRGGAMALLGLALWSSGDIEAAYETYAAGIALVHAGGYVHDSSAIMLADMRVAQGRLRDALSIYERALQSAAEQGKGAPRGTADLHVGISEVYLDLNDLDSAKSHLLISEELGEHAGLPENRFRWFTAMAALRQAEKDFDGALEMLQQAERLYTSGFSPDAQPIHAIRARLWLLQGRLQEAVEWAHQQGLSVDDPLSYLREFQHLTLARILIAQFEQGGDSRQIRDAQSLLGRVLANAEAGGRVRAVIEALVLDAIVQRALDNVPEAINRLERAVRLAESEGYVRVFVDEGPRIAMLLEQRSSRGDANHASPILAAIPNAGGTASPAPASEVLSERELEVLRLLRSDLSGPGIARELVVSLNTMRTHTKSIYAKLGVNSRREAVRRAEELHLV